uniref:Cytochrome P450-dependent monooxygenase n=1 Tax=Selaginella moellendorffii TaxID=88036 RepID=B2XCI6_SELML|nr:cytochrome P450-dependent monooxygenase [Selaginella moellendorffii]
MNWFLLTFACILTAVISVSWWLMLKSRLRLPPGPMALPIVGHLHLLLKLPHQSFHKLSHKFGPIMTIKLGNKTAIVISSKKAAKEILTSYDRVFASRPVLISPQSLCYNSKNISCCKYGPYWREMRKICTTELFSSKRLSSFQNTRLEETQNLLQRVAEQLKVPLNMKIELSTLTLNVITRMAIGKKFRHGECSEDAEPLNVILEAVRLMGAVNLGDYIPFLKRLDPGGYIPRLKTTSKKIDCILQRLVDDHREEKVKSGDLVDVLQSVGIEDSAIKAVILKDILAGGTDTTAVTTEWALSELIRNPDCLRKVQQEIHVIVGDSRLVNENDLHHLHYLKAVVKETFRLHPAAPMMAPHESIEACTLKGYTIPAKTWLLINAWSMGRDPAQWDSPEEFMPERFINSSIDVKGCDFELIPFGAGRRMCVGMSLALCMVELTLARLVQAFHWALPDGSTMNMEERQGVIVARKHPLIAVANRRLPPEVYINTL